MKIEYKVINSVWFLAGLTLLLLNDFVLKEQFSNGLTGKLSDFAGLFVFVLFWTAFLPRFKNAVFIVSSVLFILWKSSWSDPFIDTWNSFGYLPIDRIVDYTDLYALSTLPLAYLIVNRSSVLKTVRLSPVLPIILAAFAFGATSYSTNETLSKSYEINMNKDSLIARMHKLDSVRLSSRNYVSDTLDLSIDNELCHDRINVKITLTKINDSITLINMLNATHPCPKNDVEKQDIIDAFERKAINKIQK